MNLTDEVEWSWYHNTVILQSALSKYTGSVHVRLERLREILREAEDRELQEREAALDHVWHRVMCEPGCGGQ